MIVSGVKSRLYFFFQIDVIVNFVRSPCQFDDKEAKLLRKRSLSWGTTLAESRKKKAVRQSTYVGNISCVAN